MYNVGDIGRSSSGTNFKIIELRKDKRNKTIYLIEFLVNGKQKEVYGHNIKQEKVKDEYHPSIYNTGFIGNAPYKGNEKAWTLWRGMIRRCYGKDATDYSNYGAKGVVVSLRWHCFEYFLEDLDKIEGYNKFDFENGNLELDKDKKQQGLNHNQKIYSLETCCFLSFLENQAYKDKKIKSKFYAVSPKGEVLECSDGIKSFAKKYSLDESSIGACLQGRYKQHKKWKFYNNSEKGF